MQTLDIPQANDLDTVRYVVHAVWRGNKTLEAIEDWTQYSRRHVQYRLHAARVLGLVRMEGDEPLLTDFGERLMETPKGSAAERQLYAKVIEQCAVVQVVAPDLLARHAPDIEELTERLFRSSRLGAETARRRANGLLAWRRHVLGETIERNPRHPASQPPPKRHEAPKAEPGPTSKATQLDLF